MNRDVESFLIDLSEERKLSNNTIASYARDLQDFLRYLEAHGVTSWDQAASHHVKGYFMELKRQGKAPATLARNLTSIRSFYKYLISKQKVFSDPALHMDSPRVVRAEPPHLQVEEVERLLQAPDPSTPAGSRDKAMLELMYATGMRVSELTDLDVDSVHAELGFIRIIGGQGKERIVPLHRTACECLERYLKHDRKHFLKRDSNERALFLNHRGTRLSRQGFWKLMKKYAAEALQREITPHMLRHSFAFHLIQNGADVWSVQEMLGHADISSTHVYVQAGKGRMKDIYNQAHPRVRESSRS